MQTRGTAFETKKAGLKRPASMDMHIKHFLKERPDGRLNDNEKRALANVLKRYAVQLQKSQQTEQASRLQAAAASLQN